MCGAFFMALYGVIIGMIVGHAVVWLVPRLARALPVLLGGGMAVSMVYAIGYIALHY